MVSCNEALFSDTFSDTYIKNMSSLLALLHGKNDSLCRVFNREITVNLHDLGDLNKMMLEKLGLHHMASTITTSIDIVFTNKEIHTYKSWDEFERSEWSYINSATKSVFIQWDFFADIDGFAVPQRHTVSVRIASSPNPSDFFKVLLSGGFDEEEDFELQSSTMVCKVDFVNNTLAEELLNVAESWNKLRETAYSKKGMIRTILSKHRSVFAHVFEIATALTLTSIFGIAFKMAVAKGWVEVSIENLACLLIAVPPYFMAVQKIVKTGGNWLYSSFASLMDTHVFNITTGDTKKLECIEKESQFGKEIVAFIGNALFSIILSYVFFIIG